MKQRATREKERLSTLNLITSADELKKILSEIDDGAISSKKKNQKKLALIRDQTGRRY